MTPSVGLTRLLLLEPCGTDGPCRHARCLQIVWPAADPTKPARFIPSSRANRSLRGVAVEAHMPNETSQLSLTEIHRDAIKAANSSWSETDKLYVCVCAALISLAGIFGWNKAESTPWMPIAAFLLLVLAVNWMILIHRYRTIIRGSLKALSGGQESPEVKDYFTKEHNKRVRRELSDYLIAVVARWMTYSDAAGGK